MTTAALVLVVVAFVAALAVGTHQSRVQERQDARASAERDVAVSTWPRSFQRVPNVSPYCDVDAPGICLYSEEATDLVAAKVATTIGSKDLAKTPVAGAPATYTVHGTIGNLRVPVTATVTARELKPAGGTTKRTFVGSDVTVTITEPR